jgi:hypothetical protein
MAPDAWSKSIPFACVFCSDDPPPRRPSASSGEDAGAFLPIIDIKPDPDQPRKYIDPQTPEEPAASVNKPAMYRPPERDHFLAGGKTIGLKAGQGSVKQSYQVNLLPVEMIRSSKPKC